MSSSLSSSSTPVIMPDAPVPYSPCEECECPDGEGGRSPSSGGGTSSGRGRGGCGGGGGDPELKLRYMVEQWTGLFSILNTQHGSGGVLLCGGNVVLSSPVGIFSRGDVSQPCGGLHIEGAASR